jgi:hypothetical protein
MDNWKKLIRILGYKKGTIDFELIISCKNLNALTWYIDGSYAVHHDMRGKSGAFLRIGESSVLSRSINKRRIPEARLRQNSLWWMMHYQLFSEQESS